MLNCFRQSTATEQRFLDQLVFTAGETFYSRYQTTGKYSQLPRSNSENNATIAFVTSDLEKDRFHQYKLVKLSQC